MQETKTQNEQSPKPDSVSFSELILSFASTALYYMGDTALKDKDKPQQNLELAKQNIDIVYLLHEKTKGNLSSDECSLLGEVLADLSQKYAKHSNA